MAVYTLLLGVVGFAGFGIWLLIQPAAMRAVDIDAASPNARSEIRAMYGGLGIGLAIFLVLCMKDADWLYAGLVLQLLTLAGIGIGRLIGILLERGRVKRLVWFFALIEVSAAALTVAALNAGGS